MTNGALTEMRQRTADVTLGTLLRRLTELMDADVEAAYSAAGLDFRPRYTGIIRALASQGECSIKTLAAHALITHSAASQTVSQMLKEGWLISRSGDDARERRLDLSPKAISALPALRREWACTAAAAADLDAELGVSLTDVIAGAIEALARQPFRDRRRILPFAPSRPET